MIEVRTIVGFLFLEVILVPKSYGFFSRCMSHLQTELLHISPTVQTGFFQDFSDFLYFWLVGLRGNDLWRLVLRLTFDNQFVVISPIFWKSLC